MKTFRKRVTNLLTVSVLLLALLLSLTACGGGNSASGGSGDNGHSAVSDPGNSGMNEEGQSEKTGTNDTQETEQAAALTLADAKAKWVCKSDYWVVVAYYGPENVRISPYQDGAIGTWPFRQYTRDLSSGWTLAHMHRYPNMGDSPFSEEELEGLGVIVRDRMDEDSSVIFEDLEQMSEAEMREIGIPFLDGRKCMITTTGEYGGDNFCLMVQFDWIDEMSEADTEGFTEHISLFAGDGSPLESYFDGYTVESALDARLTFLVRFYFRSSDSNKDQNKAKLAELKACDPYMVYTGSDGETSKINLSWD